MSAEFWRKVGCTEFAFKQIVETCSGCSSSFTLSHEEMPCYEEMPSSPRLDEPFLVRQFAKEWPALKKWSLDYIADSLPETKVNWLCWP